MSKKGLRFIALCVSALALLVSTTSAQTRQTKVIQRAPARTIKDPYSAFSAVAVDVARNEIILEDENNAQITVFDRLENTPPKTALSKLKRIIVVRITKIQHNFTIYVDT